MLVIERTFLFISWVVIAVIVAVLIIMVLRLIADAANLNPFGFASRSIRRLSDPFNGPARRGLMGFGVDPKFTPLVVILIVILLGWFALQLADTLKFTLVGLIVSFINAAPVRAIGFVLYGLVSTYILLIFVRIIFSWGRVSHSNRLMRFLVNTTEPLLGPLRRTIPPLGMMDISPIVAFIILWLLQSAIAGTLLRGAMGFVV
jgi:YggT family protein